MYYFCTYFDQHYLARGLALYHSLREHCPACTLWVLCLDHATFQLLEQLELPDIDLSRLDDVQGTQKLLREVGVIP